MAGWVASLSPSERQALLTELTPQQLEELEYEWRFWARPEQLPPELSQGDKDNPPGPWNTWLLNAGRGFGKALALDTPLPTVAGWTTMGDVRPGEQLLDEYGAPTTVLAVHPVRAGRVCYDVEFSDGNSIVADAEHLWTTIDSSGLRSTWTTEALRHTISLGHRMPSSGAQIVVGVHPRQTVPVRCITVDSPSCLYLASRGLIPTHNTRTGAEWIRAEVEQHGVGRVALVAPTAADARDVMVEGESGLLACCPPWNMPKYEPSKRRVTWPNGAIATLFSSDEPDRLRGPQHERAWCDEISSWRYPEAWDMLMLGLRLGVNPRCCATTTPKPVKLVKKLLKDHTTAVTRGSTFDNAANLAPQFIHQIRQAYAGTRLERQEVYAELLEDVEGALWNFDLIDSKRWPKNTPLPVFRRVVVALDPAVSAGEKSDETGIIVAGLDGNRLGHVIEDLSGKYSPEKWGRIAVQAYHRWHADKIIGEANNGGDMIGAVIHQIDPNVPFKAVKASKGKFTRAEPVAALYEQGRVHHAQVFTKLEEQMCAFTPDIDRDAYDSPDRVDALVWAMWELIVENQSTGLLEFYRKEWEATRAANEERVLDSIDDGAERAAA